MLSRLFLMGGFLLILSGCSGNNYSFNNHKAYLYAEELPTLKLMKIGKSKSPNKRYEIPMVEKKVQIKSDELSFPPDFRNN